MRKEQAITDNLAIGLSILCVMQCLAVPSILVLLPSVVAYHLQNEAFHFWMIVVVLPVSVFALTLGCKQHNRYHVMIFGVIGLVLLVSAIVAGDVIFGENGEKILTEKTLDHLSGYQGSKPVRIGNAAFIQKQNDIYDDIDEPIKKAPYEEK